MSTEDAEPGVRVGLLLRAARRVHGQAVGARGAERDIAARLEKLRAIIRGRDAES